MSDDLLKPRSIEVPVEDYLELLGDHCKRRNLEPMMTTVLTLLAKNASNQPGATARTIAEALMRKAQPLNEKHRDAVYEFIHMNFPDMVQGLYTPRVSTQEDILVSALAASVSAEQGAVLGGDAPVQGAHRSKHPTMIDLAALEAGAVPARGSLSGDRLPTVHYIEHPEMAAKGGVADILEEERKAGEELAAKEAAARAAEEAAAEALRRKNLDEAAARTGRGKMDTLDSDAGSAGSQPAKVSAKEGGSETAVMPVDLNGRETLAAVSDADLLEAAEIARRRSAAMSVIDSEEEGVPPSDRVTALLPPEPK